MYFMNNQYLLYISQNVTRFCVAIIYIFSIKMNIYNCICRKFITRIYVNRFNCAHYEFMKCVINTDLIYIWQNKWRPLPPINYMIQHRIIILYCIKKSFILEIEGNFESRFSSLLEEHIQFSLKVVWIKTLGSKSI